MPNDQNFKGIDQVLPIKPSTNNIYNQNAVVRLKGTRFIENCSGLKQVAETIIKDLDSKYPTISEKWINDQFGLCLRGVLCSKKGKLFSSKYQPKRTVELLDIRTTDRIVISLKTSKNCTQASKTHFHHRNFGPYPCAS